ncbi:hypothetical protein EB259_21420 [Salmonella enterica]|nr:hypothetical protein [Salmonella enterica]EBE4966286.1 hypothetical protein [Salmonella enterica]EBT5331609.1 hypothetical protein [Salmonella enterica]ECH4619393.1 hypothetical protein [Salmonella enterica]MDJ43516.1 hypothetical protein [Salmonella enterica]
MTKKRFNRQLRRGVLWCPTIFDISDSYFTSVRFRSIGPQTPKQGQVAAVIYANCAELDNNQLDEIIEWVRLFRC